MEYRIQGVGSNAINDLVQAGFHPSLPCPHGKGMISQKGDPTLQISNKGFSPRNIAGIGKDARKLWAANAVPVGATAGVTS